MEQEKIIETKTCKLCSVSFDITDKDLEFYNKVSPVFNSEKYSIPAPTLCPDCRQQRRLSFRNERKLYHRKCDLTWKQIISVYSPDKPFKVYEQAEWWSDKWDPKDYSRDFDFSKGFFEQFAELQLDVPRVSLYVDDTCTNCDFTNQVSHCKDWYLIISCSSTERCMYSKRVNDSEDCVDCFFGIKSRVCYECSGVLGCNNCFYVTKSISCSYSSFLHNCEWCSNCFFCVNLTNKSYCIYNKEYPKDEYEMKIKEILSKRNINDFRDEFNKFKLGFPNKNLDVKNVENVIGNNVQNAKDSYLVFDATNIENIKFWQFVQDSVDLYDADYVCCNSTLSYEVVSGWIDMYNCLFWIDIWPVVNNLIYCDACNTNSSYLFGCIGLRNAKYCILNKQYTKEQYEELVPKIIEQMKENKEWWEFFPSSLSPFWYNETIANDYYPIERRDAINHASTDGKAIFKWSDYEKQNWYEWEYYTPLQISEYKEESVWKELAFKNTTELLRWIMKCEISSKPFRIIKQELEFYIKHNLSIPRRHPDQRHLDRMSSWGQIKLFDRTCDKCNKPIKTVYSPEKPEIVYCEECYAKVVY
ncbi:MAG: hypothetical protein ACD_3C00123G0015 [uncultured bacterium (gcode 4)]|uniref:Uncharacterized protein n=1 Tax=uncultured bacterium (gcode 4) TaxID=1234023 RepID=K2GCG7_9BACT|nr:MAG: hypothetical protein ACD_3C00123G0015 [uncultured bacterium (gcode 4)]